MLSLVQHGRRILLRAQDGQPATFFVGDRVPVELSSFSASLSGTGESVAGLSATNFPTTNYDTGAAPTFVATASLRDNSINDLISPISLTTRFRCCWATGDGTFGAQTTFPTGVGPVWATTGIFRSASGNQNSIWRWRIRRPIRFRFCWATETERFSRRSDIPAGTAPSQRDREKPARPERLRESGSDRGESRRQHDLHLSGKRRRNVQSAEYDSTAERLCDPRRWRPRISMAMAMSIWLVADEGNATISVFLGNGDGTFGARTDYAVGNSPVWVATGDFNGDGVLDLAVANKADDTVSILFGNADIQLQPDQHHRQRNVRRADDLSGGSRVPVRLPWRITTSMGCPIWP